MKQQKLERRSENQKIGTVASSDAISRYLTQNDHEVMSQLVKPSRTFGLRTI